MFKARIIVKYFPVTLLSIAVAGCDGIGEELLGEPPDLARFLDTEVGSCAPYSQSSLYRSRSATKVLYPESNWISEIQNAAANTEILLEDGDYRLNQYSVRVKDGVTIRSLNGDRNRVRIIGMGYAQESEGLMITGNDVTLADFSISKMRNHAVSVKPDLGASFGLQLYNLGVSDVGTQHIKVNPGGARDGLIACSSIGYSDGAAVGDYNGAVDLHGTIDWVVRDNYIYNISGDGSGCIVDRDCGNIYSAPAILAWRGASGTRVTGNTIVDSYRNIAFGIGSSHVGGAILHNRIKQTAPGDAGIELFGATDVVVEFNTVELSGPYPGTIEFRQSKNLTITNNWLSRQPWNRGGNENVELSGNAFRVPRRQ